MSIKPHNHLPDAAVQVLNDQFFNVRVPMQQQYVFPVKCVVCGKPSVPGLSHKVSLQKSNPNLFTPGGWHEIEFPVCAECDQLARVARKKSRAGCLPAGLLGIVVSTLIFFLTNYGIIPAMLAGCLAIVLGWILFSWISDRRIPPEMLDRYRQLILAVKISHLYSAVHGEDTRVDIRFSSQDYAHQFTSLNDGEIL
jgi:hypothetical protein